MRITFLSYKKKEFWVTEMQISVVVFFVKHDFRALLNMKPKNQGYKSKI